MKIEQHITNSLTNIKENHPKIYHEKQITLRELLPELHRWLDDFKGKKTEKYDYSNPRFSIRHREQRHHHEGIREAVEIFSEKYGQIFKQLIQEELERHVRDDMGQLLFKSDYNRIGFWRNPFGTE